MVSGALVMMAVTLAVDIGGPGPGAPRFPRGEGAAPSSREYSLPRPGDCPARGAAPPLPAEYPLRRSGEGFVYDATAFVADIARDGVVTFHSRNLFFSRPGFVSKRLPLPGPNMSLNVWLFGRPHQPWPEPATPRVASPAQGFDLPEPVLCPHGAFDPRCFELYHWPLIGGLAVTGDGTDEIMRSLGEDPYAAEKADFLAATFEFRMELAVRAHRQDMRTSLDSLPARLEGLWRDTRYSAPEHRRILFELWREADTTPEGRSARTIIETFIRRELPCGSADAYTSAELRDLQASERGFSPYGSCGR